MLRKTWMLERSGENEVPLDISGNRYVCSKDNERKGLEKWIDSLECAYDAPFLST